MRRLFSKHWERDVSNAINSRAIGGTETVVRDGYDYLGVSHFFQIFERFYDNIVSAEVGQPSAHPKPSKVKVLGKLKSIKDSRDPLSHPVAEEIHFHEAHHLIIDAKHVLSWLGLEEESARLSTLAATLDRGDGAGDVLTVTRRLPTEDSIYIEFVGRDAVLNDLSECFGNADSKRCLLAGDGGKGKSAVAFRFAQMLSQSPGRFQLIVWLSAKRRRFQGGKSVAIDNPDFSSRQDAVDKILLEYGAIEDDFAKDRKEKEIILRQYLNEFPAFIVADDIDTVLEDDDLVSLFSHEIPHTNSAVLLTSRRTIQV